jgi:hypothetical protein
MRRRTSPARYSRMSTPPRSTSYSLASRGEFTKSVAPMRNKHRRHREVLNRGFE